MHTLTDSTHPPSTEPVVGGPTTGGTTVMSHLVVGMVVVLVVLAATIGLIVGQALGARGAEAPSAVMMAERPSDMYEAMADIAAISAHLDEVAAQQAAASARASRPTRPAVHVDPTDPTVWDQLAQCETGGNWATDSVAGFSGGLGFANGTWTANGGGAFAGVAADATREQQIEIAQRVLAGSGWGAWPGCSSLLGLR